MDIVEQLTERAKAQRRAVALPEGDDPRILRAARRWYARGEPDSLAPGRIERVVVRLGVAHGKNAGFIGRDAVLRQREEGLKKRLVQFALEDPEPLLYHYERIRRDGEIVGYLTSGMFGHTVGTAIGMGYLHYDADVTRDWIEAGRYHIEIAGEPCPTRASLGPFYDPRRERMLA